MFILVSFCLFGYEMLCVKYLWLMCINHAYWGRNVEAWYFVNDEYE